MGRRGDAYCEERDVLVGKGLHAIGAECDGGGRVSITVESEAVGVCCPSWGDVVFVRRSTNTTIPRTLRRDSEGRPSEASRGAQHSSLGEGVAGLSTGALMRPQEAGWGS